jgi:hypothetical protein
MNLTRVYDFMQVFNSERKHATKNQYFSKYILFTTEIEIKSQQLI